VVVVLVSIVWSRFDSINRSGRVNRETDRGFCFHDPAQRRPLFSDLTDVAAMISIKSGGPGLQPFAALRAA